MAPKRNSMVFTLTDQDRELMEAFRARRGLRSLADALRTMIRESAPQLASNYDYRQFRAAVEAAPGGAGLDTSSAKVTVPGKSYFRPNPKPSKK